MAEVEFYQDPLILLLKDPDLNKERAKSSQLLALIRKIPPEQVRLKQSCLDGFQILRDLERIQLRSSTWHKATLDFQIVSQTPPLSPEEFRKRHVNSQLATKVLLSCLDLRRLLIDISEEVEDLNEYVSTLSPLQCISDPGTIICELSFRIIRLKNNLEEEISVTYSKAKLITIGKELEDHLFLYDDTHLLSKETVEKYTAFVNQLLKQLNDCVSQNDTIGTMECVAVVNDVEKMFEAMQFKRKVLELKSPASTDLDRSEILSSNSIYESDEDFKHHSTVSSVSSLDSPFTAVRPVSSKLSDELPHLLNAFKSPQPPVFMKDKLKQNQMTNVPATFKMFAPPQLITSANIAGAKSEPANANPVPQPPVSQRLVAQSLLKPAVSLWGQSLTNPLVGRMSDDKPANEYTFHDIDNLVD